MSNYTPRLPRNTIPTCEHKHRKVKARGLCGSCYNRAYKNETLEPSYTGICPVCKTEPRSTTKSGLLSGYCKTCTNLYDKAWRHKNPERWSYHQWKARLKHFFGITPEKFEEMWSNQDGKCSICGIDLIKHLEVKENPPNKACVDHNHETKVIRDLLCNPCNQSLGNMKESPDLLRKAADYLERHGRN